VELMVDRPDVALSERRVRASAPARAPRLHAGMDAVLRMQAALPTPVEVLPVTMDYRDHHQAWELQNRPQRPAVHYPPRLHPAHPAAAPAQITIPPAPAPILAALLALSACQTRNATPRAPPRTLDVELDAARTDSPVTPAPRFARKVVAVPIMTTATAVPLYSPSLLPLPVAAVAARPIHLTLAPPHSVDQLPRRVSQLAETVAVAAVEAAVESPLVAPVHPDPGSFLEWE